MPSAGRHGAPAAGKTNGQDMKVLKHIVALIFGLLFHNFITKLLCLVMAFVLYVYVNTSENIDRDFVVPISISNRPPSLLITQQSASEARLVVNGPKAKMDQLKPEDLALTLSLRDSQRPGEVSFRLYADQVATPPGIRVRSLEPASVLLQLESIVARTVEIRAMLDGQPREGYEVAEVKVTPPLIEVAGPPSVLGRMSSIETDPVDIEGMTGSFKQRVGFRTPNLVSLSVRRSTIVAVTIRERTLHRTFESRPVRAVSGRTDLTIEPALVEVALEGPYSIVQAMTPELLEPVVSDDGLLPGQSAQRPVVLRAVPPQRIEVSIEPAEVRIAVPTPSPASATEAAGTPSPVRKESP
jgi:YbbR domain-containing protein